MKNQSSLPYILGLDIGANSIGWAIIDMDSNEKPIGIRKAGVGVRIFEEGIANYDMGKKEQGLGKQRRIARLARRREDRHVRRLNHLFSILQNSGLLPLGNEADGTIIPPKPRSRKAREDRQWREQKAKARHIILYKLDDEIKERRIANLRSNNAPADELKLVPKKLPYILRARALEEKLELHEIGRTLYHLAERRGFKSNRKSISEDEETKEKIKDKDLKELKATLKVANFNTISAYIASKVNPEQDRIRSKYTSREIIQRADYQKEFNLIWDSQKEWHPSVLTDNLKKEISDTIFYQRKPWWDKDTIGNCELEPGEKGAPWATLDAQRFRMIQKVNDLCIIEPEEKAENPLDDDQRKKLIDVLEYEEAIDFRNSPEEGAASKSGKRGKRGKSTFTVLEILGLSDKYSFNLERGGNKQLLGNGTSAQMAKALGLERWKSIKEGNGDRIVQTLLDAEDDEEAKLALSLKEIGLSEKELEALLKIKLEGKYCNYSETALAKLLPKMEEGKQEEIAKREVYGPPKEVKAVNFLQPVLEVLPSIRMNPIVTRCLTELRKIINALIPLYGKPKIIRVEMARDLKKGKKQREVVSKNNEFNKLVRNVAENEIKYLPAFRNQKPQGKDILKYRLWDEANRECPYCGQGISPRELFSNKFAIDHIVPRSVILDDSFFNKVVCCNRCNNEKGDKTPVQAFGGDHERWKAILERVEHFKGAKKSFYNKKIKQIQTNEDDKSSAKEKARRFCLDGEPLGKFCEKFTNDQLNNTAYASRMARKYLGLLYGGKETDWPIQATSGGITDVVRDALRLNWILGGPKKRRDDHRHHAIDAVVVALSDHSIVKRISDASAKEKLEHHKNYPKINPPWDTLDTFGNGVKNNIDSIIVSHRVSRKVSGALHEEKYYSPQRDKDGKEYKEGDNKEDFKFVHVRRAVYDLSPAMIERIGNKAVDMETEEEETEKEEIGSIVDKKIAECVKRKLLALGYNMERPKEKEERRKWDSKAKEIIKKLKNDPPLMKRGIPIKKVRVRQSLKVEPLGESETNRRYVKLGNIHHIEIWEDKEDKDVNGQPKWEGEVVTMYKAYSLKKKGLPIVQSDHGPRTVFKFSLSKGEMVKVKDDNGDMQYHYVSKLSQNKQIFFLKHTFAGKKEKYWSKKPDTLRLAECRKVIITPLGEERWAND